MTATALQHRRDGACAAWTTFPRILLTAKTVVCDAVIFPSGYCLLVPNTFSNVAT